MADRTQRATPYDDKSVVPSHIDVEQTVLACILNYGGAGSELLGGLESADFYAAEHRVIFRAMRRVAEKHGSIAPEMVAAELRKLNMENECGGAEYLRTVGDRYTRIEHMPQLKTRMRELRVLREAMERSRELYDACQQAADDPVLTLAIHGRRIKDLMRLLMAEQQKPVRSMGELMQELDDLQWLWPEWIPKGQLTLIVAEPGVGKSALALHLAGSALGAWAWPDGAEPEGASGPALYCDTEANQRQLVTRVRAWSIPSEALVVWRDDPPFALDDHNCLRLAEEIICEENCPIMIVDTLSAAFRGDENSADVAAMLRPWIEMALRTNIALVIIHHERKKQKGERDGGLSCVRGSSVLTAMPRSIIRLSHHERAEGQVCVEVIKANYAADRGKLVMTQGDDGLRFEPYEESEDRPSGKLAQARELLLEELAAGPMPAEELLQRAEASGISRASLYRARQDLDISTGWDEQEGGGRRSVWYPPAEVLETAADR